ncbi:hypothetical protein ABB37_00083 [Leptomonas pyrrhocoris]|uniref:Uncharacterized protein n=1 Tax=Leptomonas pyrrhocoris TaxID=157538 RepID=A0A0M9G9P0_LEPPY|nr:hypothetical protein ABB37_00083 [Leptomonas pyrrhocoris]KPA85710.1 hypothetical protein ABB37_00083 [Leptomonas pyrrhocoris]|eukprot:XP_015664149.1 hypothetical protein ABB37_00083 [Leptomonas pyrrhocoris]
MHFSRKRFRPLDFAEERAVHVGQRVQLLPLADEQSYCFSWPEAPLTQWLQENAAYATLYQLIANASGGSLGGSSASTTSRHDALSTAGLKDDHYNVGSSTGSVGGRRDALGNSPASAVSSSATLASSRRRQVDLPPVFTLDDVGEPRLLFSTPSASGILLGPPAATSHPRCRCDVDSLLLRLQHDIDAVNQNASSTAAARDDGIPVISTSSVAATAQELRTAKSRIAQMDGKTGDLAAPPTSIVIDADAPLAVPHPLAPPRPQSITEDSIFTLSESQLIDLAVAGLPALCAAEEAFLWEQEQQLLLQRRESKDKQRLADAKSGRPQHGAPQDVVEGVSPSPSSPAMVVVIEEGACANEGGGGDDASSAPSRGAGAANSLRLQEQQQQQQLLNFPESHRRAIEQEVVGLEWRTWTQSQRTAAALQRLLSLEAAVPFEPCGDAHRDAWRVRVYRLWLRWRQQIPHETESKISKVSCSPVHSATDQKLPPSLASPSPPPPPPTLLHPYVQPHRLPWGVPLLAGAYLYGTSNDYFISLPAAGAALSAGGGSGGTPTFSSLVGGSAGGASMWPAVSRRRGVYNFLRWKVELHEAQMPHLADGAEVDDDGGEDAENVLDNDNDGDAVSDADVKKTKSGNNNNDAEGVTNGSSSARMNRYAKGPLGQTETLPSGRPKRRGVSDKSEHVEATASSSSPSSPSAASRRPLSSRTPAAQAVARSTPHHSLNTVMSAAHIKALIQSTVLTQPLTELQMDDEPSAVMERLACPDLLHETDAWRVWLSKV